MGVDVALVRVEQRGTSPRRRRDIEVSNVSDLDDRLARILTRVQRGGTTPMLDRIGLWHDLELVPEDMPQLLAELDRVLAGAQDQPERDIILAVARLAEQCRDDRQLRLKFLGD